MRLNKSILIAMGLVSSLSALEPELGSPVAIHRSANPQAVFPAARIGLGSYPQAVPHLADEKMEKIVEGFMRYAHQDSPDDKESFMKKAEIYRLQIALRTLEMKIGLSEEKWVELSRAISFAIMDAVEEGLSRRANIPASDDNRDELPSNFDISSVEGEFNTLLAMQKIMELGLDESDVNEITERMKSSHLDPMSEEATVELVERIVLDFMDVVDSEGYTLDQFEAQLDRNMLLLWYVTSRAHVTNAIVTEYGHEQINFWEQQFDEAVARGRLIREKLSPQSPGDDPAEIANKFKAYVDKGIAKGDLSELRFRTQVTKGRLPVGIDFTEGPGKIFKDAFYRGRREYQHLKQCAEQVKAGRRLLNERILPLKKAAIASLDDEPVRGIAKTITANLNDILDSFVDLRGNECLKQKRTFIKEETEKARRFENAVIQFHTDVFRIATAPLRTDANRIDSILAIQRQDITDKKQKLNKILPVEDSVYDALFPGDFRLFMDYRRYLNNVEEKLSAVTAAVEDIRNRRFRGGPRAPFEASMTALGAQQSPAALQLLTAYTGIVNAVTNQEDIKRELLQKFRDEDALYNFFSKEFPYLRL